MKKNFMIIILAIGFLTFNPGCWAAETNDTLKTGAEGYINFLNLVGKAEEKTFATQVPALFAAEFKKVINGKTALTGRDQFARQLQKTLTKVGSWTVENIDTIVSSEDHACVVRYVLKSSKKGTFTTMAILRFDDKGLISEVNEVYNKLDK